MSRNNPPVSHAEFREFALMQNFQEPEDDSGATYGVLKLRLHVYRRNTRIVVMWTSFGHAINLEAHGITGLHPPWGEFGPHALQFELPPRESLDEETAKKPQPRRWFKLAEGFDEEKKQSFLFLMKL